MKNLFLLFAFFMLSLLTVQGQTATDHSATADTANYPYWIEMMQDPGANFFATQRAFELYWKGRPITKGSGYKVFKRWEYMNRWRVAPDGTLPAPDAISNAYHTFEHGSGNRSMSGNWISMGPSTIPAPGPAGYEGLGRLNVVAFHPTDPNKIYVGAPSGGLWMTADGGLTWVTHTDTMPSLGVSAIVVDYSNTNVILMGTGDRDAGDAPGLGVYKSVDGGIAWIASKNGMNNKTVGRIIQHPTNPLIFLAATSGGVYRSTDGGSNWSVSQGGNFKDIHFKPNDPNIVYGASGSDFYRSADNGITFTKITSVITPGQRGVIAVTPANPNYVYFMQSASNSGFKALYRSTDAGMTFTTMSTTPNILDWSCDGSGSGGQGWYDLALAADPVNAETIYAGGVDVWKSTNGGSTWTINSHWWGDCSVPAVHADCHYLTFSPVNGKLYAANDGGLWSTSNGGTTWTDHTVGMTIGQIYKLGQAQTEKSKVINGFQDNGTYAITPGGWIAVGGGDGMECAVDYTNASRTYHTIYYGDIYRRYNNSGEKHIAGNGVYGITESGAWVTPFCLNRFNNKGMFVGYKNIWRSNDVTTGTIVWTKISDNLAGSNNNDMAVVEHSAVNENLFYAARYDNKFFRSDDCMGTNPSWINLTSNLPVAGTPSDIESSPIDENIVYITLAKKVYKSTDKGITWTNITGNLPDVNLNTIAYYRNAPEGLYVGGDAGVYYRDETTTGWLPFGSGLPVNVKITELEIYYDNDSVSQDAIRASTYGRGLWGSDLYHINPTADFTADKTTIPIGCDVNFEDHSTGVPTFFQWSFPGGTPASSSVKNPENIVYDQPGTYQVTLKVWNEFGSDSITKINYITVSSTLLPVANFETDNNVPCFNETVHFTDLTENCPGSWYWQFTPSTVTFMDGTSAASQNPAVRFNEPGLYDVQLTTSNAVGPAFVSKAGYIISGGYALPFTEKFAGGFNEHFWKVVNTDLMITWDTISVAGTVDGSKAAWMNFFDYNLIDRRDQLISPVLNFTGYSGVTLSFRHAYEQRVRKDSLIIKVSDDCGLTWDRIWAMGPDGTPNQFVTHPPTNTEFFPQSADDWCSGSYGVDCYSIDLATYAGKNNVKILFESFNRYGNNLFINDIQISGPVGISDPGTNDVKVSIYPNPSSESFNLSISNIQSGVSVSVVTPMGQTVGRLFLEPENGKIDKKMNLEDNAPGVYFIHINAGEKTIVKKVIIY